jgi:hypothetical protein
MACIEAMFVSLLARRGINCEFDSSDPVSH